MIKHLNETGVSQVHFTKGKTPPPSSKLLPRTWPPRRARETA